MSPIAAPANSVTESNSTHLLAGLPDWAFYTFGVMFIIIGILSWCLYPRAKKKAEHYKAEQLKEFNIQKNRSVTNYKTTGMYLPAWEKTKLFAPTLLGTVMIIIGIAWLSMRTLGYL